jgi:hypothetical protein
MGLMSRLPWHGGLPGRGNLRPLACPTFDGDRRGIPTARTESEYATQIHRVVAKEIHDGSSYILVVPLDKIGTTRCATTATVALHGLTSSSLHRCGIIRYPT